MFSLYFFCGNDPEVALAIVEGRAKRIDDYGKEGTFDSFLAASSRLNRIGSKWIFYPNAFITRQVDDREEVLVIYMEDGISFVTEGALSFVQDAMRNSSF